VKEEGGDPRDRGALGLTNGLSAGQEGKPREGSRRDGEPERGGRRREGEREAWEFRRRSQERERALPAFRKGELPKRVRWELFWPLLYPIGSWLSRDFQHHGNFDVSHHKDFVLKIATA